MLVVALSGTVHALLCQSSSEVLPHSVVRFNMSHFSFTLLFHPQVGVTLVEHASDLALLSRLNVRAPEFVPEVRACCS